MKTTKNIMGIEVMTETVGTTGSTGTIGGGKKVTYYGKTYSAVSTTPDIVCVPKDYIVDTLCSGCVTYPAICDRLFTTATTSMVNVSKGIMIYTLYKEGEYEFTGRIPFGSQITRDEVLETPMAFLTDSLRNAWQNIVKEWVASDVMLAREDVLNLWSVFLFYTLDGNIGLFADGIDTTAVGYGKELPDVSKDVLFYTLYREGEFIIDSCYVTDGKVTRESILNVPMSFLPKEMSDRFQNLITTRIPSGTPVAEEKLMNIWRDFLFSAIFEDDIDYVEIFAAFWPYLEYDSSAEVGCGGVRRHHH